MEYGEGMGSDWVDFPGVHAKHVRQVAPYAVLGAGFTRKAPPRTAAEQVLEWVSDRADFPVSISLYSPNRRII